MLLPIETLASEILAGMVKALGKRHAFLTDDQPWNMFPEWCRQAARTTDGHVLKLVESHGAKLATLDHGIPGAFLVPE